MKKTESLKQELNILKFVWKMASGEHGKMIIVMLIKILIAILPAGIAYFVKNYIDGQPDDFFNLHNEELLFFLTVVICSIFLKLLSDLIMGRSIPEVKRKIEVCYIQKFATLPHFYITDYIDNRMIITLSLESRLISSLIPMVYRSFIMAPVTILAFVAILLFVSPVLTAICLVLISMIFAGVTFFRKKIKRLNRDTYNKIADQHQHFSEWLEGYKVFVTSNAPKYIERQLLKISGNVAHLSKNIASVTVLQSMIIELVTIMIAILFVIVASKNPVSNNILNLGELLLFPTAILFIRNEILNIVYGYVQLTGTESAATRIIEVVNHSFSPVCGKEKLKSQVTSITFSNVSFCYEKSAKDVLCQADIILKKGKVNTIVGRSGIGKTSFINLCMRLRLPNNGTIFYNQQDINNISEENLMSRIALVEQEPFIFDASLIENIYFDRYPDIEYVLSLLNDFGLSYLAKTKDELFNTLIGKKGRQLSTGEKQRISIIRALVKKADVIFFDEITSNLDSWNTRKIIDCVHEIAENKLVVCVSNDLMFIGESDVLYEIINGKLKCLKE